VAITLIAGLVIGMLFVLGGSTRGVFSSINSQINNIGGPTPSASPSPSGNPPAPIVGPPVTDPITFNPTYPLTCTGYTPYSSVTVLLIIGSSSGPVATLIADENGTASGDIPIPPDATPGTYSFRCQGPTADGVQTSPPTSGGPVADTSAGQAPQANFSYIISPTVQASDVPTMQVSVNACSPAYHRAGPTMNSTGTLLAPGTTMWVYSAPVDGGLWPRGGWDNPYTCPDPLGGTYGAGASWYQLTDGSGYIFAEGVSGTGLTGTAPGPAASAYDVAFTDTSNGEARTDWAWNFGDAGSTSTLPNPSHVYPGPGSYTVTFTATGPDGTDTTTETVTIATVSDTPPSVYATADQGANWTVLPGGIAAYSVDATHAYALVDPNYLADEASGNFPASQVYYSDNGGASWTKVLDLGTLASGDDLQSMTIAGSDVYAIKSNATYDGSGIATSTVYRATIGGAFAPVGTVPGAAASVYAFDSSHLFASTFNGPDSPWLNALYWSADSGATWALANVPTDSNGNSLMDNIAFRAASGAALDSSLRAYVVFSDATYSVASTADGGQTWTVAASDFPNHGAYVFGATDAQVDAAGNVYVVTDSQIGPIYDEVYTSTDHGANWQLTLNWTGDYQPQLANLNGVVYALGSADIWSSADGTTWADMPGSFSPLLGLAGDASSLHNGSRSSTDGGTTWSGPDGSIYGPAVAFGSSIYALDALHGSLVYGSTDNGASWHPALVGASGEQFSLGSPSDGSHLLVVGLPHPNYGG
jgi:PKD repeat protein